MDFEDILLEVGDYGKYQRNLILIFLVPAASLLPWFSMNILFMVSSPDHWCYVPEVAASNLNISIQRSLISPPDSPSCHMYDINYTEFLEAGIYKVPNDTTTRPCTQGWQYDKTDYESTAVTQWNLVCNDDHYKSFILTMFNVGSIIGTPIYGALSDRIGRKITFFITILVTAVTAIASVLMTNFTAFVVIKTINGTLMPSVFQLPYIIVLEIVSPEMRTRMNGVVNCAWTFGLCFLPLIAYLSRSWVTLGLITSSVTVIYLLYWSFLPESPRWLVSQERYDDALVIMHRIAEKNEKVQDRNVLLQKLQKLGDKIKKEKKVDGVKNSSSDILKYPQLRKKFIIITFCWMADIMAYYGLQLNVSNLAGNEFINFFLLALVEIPGYLTSWVIMERFGRRWCSVGGFILTGVICMLPSLEFPYGDVLCSLIGKFFAAATFMATYQQSSELYPTVVRSLGMGMSSTVAFVATLIVPYLVYLSVYGKAIPFLIIGMSCIIAGIMASFLPETLNENLPQTIFDAEEFGRHQKFFSCNRRRLSISRERAASLGKVKALENIFTCDEKETNSHQAVRVLQNSDLVPNGENYVAMTEPEKALNGGSNSLRKRNNSEYVTKDVPTEDVRFPTTKSIANEDEDPDCQNSESSEKVQYGTNIREQNKENIHTENVECEEKREFPIAASTDTMLQSKDFAYINSGFYNIDEDARRKNEQSESKQNISLNNTLEKERDLDIQDIETKNKD